MPTITPQKYLLTWSCISLRTLIVTSLYNIVVLLRSGGVSLDFALQLVILVHHGLSVWYLESLTIAKDFRPLPAILDWLLISGEISTWFNLNFLAWRVDQWTTSINVVLFGSLYVQLVILILLCVIRSISLIQQLLLRPCLPPDLTADLFSPTNDLPQNKNFSKGRLQLILGRSLLGPKVRRGKRGILIVVRAILALAMFLGMLTFAIFSLIIWPVSETGKIPVKTLRGVNLQSDFQPLSPSWNVFIIIDREVVNFTVDAMRDAIRVTPLWEDIGRRVQSCSPKAGWNPPCQIMDTLYNADASGIYSSVWGITVSLLHYSCPTRCTRNLTFDEFLNVPTRDTLPDLLVTVNFTILGISPLSSSVGGTQLMSVDVIVAFIDDTGEVLRVSSATSLLPGMHSVGRVGMEFRSLFTNSRLAALGLDSQTQTFMAGKVYDLTQDPAPPSPDITTASLRLYVPYDRSEWIFIQEAREKSVLGGFAAVGGLWAALNGIFSFFFGGTLALLLWGRKPLSIFGLLDKPWQESIREEWREEVREAMSKDAKADSLLDDKEWIMLLRTKLVDVNPLDSEDS